MLRKNNKQKEYSTEESQRLIIDENLFLTHKSMQQPHIPRHNFKNLGYTEESRSPTWPMEGRHYTQYMSTHTSVQYKQQGQTDRGHVKGEQQSYCMDTQRNVVAI